MRKLFLAAITFAFLLAGLMVAAGAGKTPAQAAEVYGAAANPTGDPIGGGAGYSHIIRPDQARYVVSTKSGLLSALTSAQSGQIIYVDDSASIDLSGTYGINVPDGVTIASGRGRNGSLGGRIYFLTQTVRYKHLFITGSHVTFSGIRLEGPDGTVGTSAALPLVDGIFCDQHHGLVVENCEIYNWTYAGISYWHDGLPGFQGGGWVHHNYIHNCQRLGLGYGIQVAGAWCLIEANHFNYSRHHICGARGGPPGCNYEARYNIFGTATHTLVDCHGGNDAVTEGSYVGPDPNVPAGGTLLVHHNTFKSSSQPSVKPRGVPYVICDVYNNWTYQTSQSAAFKQEVNNLGLTPYVHMTMRNNWYGTTPPPGYNLAPVLYGIGGKSVPAGSNLSFTISGSDPDGSALTYSAANLPQGASFSPSTRTFSWTPGQSQGGTYTVRFQVSDGALTDTEDVPITVSAGNSVPSDVNMDGDVNSLDMIRIGQHWGESSSAGWIREDINQDGVVSVLDATLIGQSWTG